MELGTLQSAICPVHTAPNGIDGTIRHYTALYGTVRHSMVLYGNLWYSTALYGTVRHHMVLYGTIWYYTALCASQPADEAGRCAAFQQPLDLPAHALSAEDVGREDLQPFHALRVDQV